MNLIRLPSYDDQDAQINLKMGNIKSFSKTCIDFNSGVG